MLIKKFVRSLKGTAFDWYTGLPAQSIDSWDQMETEFYKRFFSTQRVVSMTKLMQVGQWKDEPVLEYINRWRALSLECKDRLTETSAVEMCINGMDWDLLYILQGIRPRSFQELATRAHDMEISLKNKKKGTSSEAKKEKKEYTKVEKPFKSLTKETMSVTTSSAPIKISGKALEEYKASSSRFVKSDKPTLKELQAKKYPFPDSDLPGMLDDLLKNKVIELPESKRPEQMGRTSDPKYCPYHRLVNHPIEKCITLKEKIMQLAKDGKIVLDLDEAVTTNHASVVCESLLQAQTLQFGSLEPVIVYVIRPAVQQDDVFPVEHEEDDEGWTVVTRKRPRKQVHRPQPQPPRHKKKPQKKKSVKRSKGKKKFRGANKQTVLPIDMLEQEPLDPVTLEEFFPEDYFTAVTVNTVSFIEGEEELVGEEATSIKLTSPHSEPVVDSKVAAILEALPSRMGWKQIFHLPKEMCQQVALALQHPELYVDKVKDAGDPAENSAKCLSCNTALAFTDDDLLMGSKPHNRPLFVSGYIREQKVGRILVDGGSAVNIMPKSTMIDLGIKTNELSTSRIVIQGFNLDSQRAIGIIRLELTMGELTSSTLFHVIDTKTSYKMLLGRPWLHENGVVASTLHQCLKYYRGGEKKINGDVKPFAKADSYFADAKFFEDEGASSEILPSQILSTGKKDDKKKVDSSLIPKEPPIQRKELQKEKVTKEVVTQPIQKAKASSSAPILRYIPKSQRKEGESPFAECQDSKLEGNVEKKVDALALQDLKSKTIFPLAKGKKNKIIKSPTVEEPSGVKELNKEKFDPNAYKLLAKSGYDFENPTPMGKVIDAKPHGLNDTQKKLLEYGDGFQESKTGVGFKRPTPVKISIWRKVNTSSSQYITAEEVEENKVESDGRPEKTSVFDRLCPPATKNQASMFDRLGEHDSMRKISSSPQTKRKGSVFSRVGVSSMPDDQPRRSALSRIRKRNDDARKNDDAKESDDARSVVPSRMKRTQDIDITEQQPLKARVRTVVFTNQEKSSDNFAEDDREFVSSNHVTAQEVSNSDEEIETEVAPKILEDGGQTTVDELKELNLGTLEEPRPVYVSSLLTQEEEHEYAELLSEFKDVFAWSYKEMPGLDPRIAVHRLAIKKGVSPKKQSQRRFRPELIPEIESEVNKLIGADFIREVKYPTWIANVVPVRKKNGQLRVCVDFRDLNEACPKDDFPLPVTEIMIDATTGHEALSFMDCTAGYNQIRMAPEDQEATAFRTPKGIFCYKVMPFGLKNAGATYQRAMQKIFEDMMHKIVECYVDDLVVKSKKRESHLSDLRKVFERLRKCQLKMNPLKCAFGVTSGKFLGFIVRHRGIEIDQTKIKAIQEMPEPRNLKELRGLQGRLAYIRRFISNLAGRCHPFNHLMKKDTSFDWDDSCRKAFESIKKYLSSPPVLGAPVKGKPLILYIAAQERSLGAMCAQEIEDRKETALYYLSRTLVGAELNYSPIEKICLALVFAIQKLKHYMQAHTVHVISKADPIKYILSRPVLSGRLAKWVVLIKQYDIVYVPQKSVKGQAIADFFADHPVPPEWELSVDLPGEDVFYIDVLPPWEMYFDGAARQDGAGAGVVFLSPEKHVLTYSFVLTQLCSNNMAEYQALILGLQMAVGLGLKDLDIYGDSQLVISQLLGEYEVKKEDLIPHHRHATKLLEKLDNVKLNHVPRSANKMADALAGLAATLALGAEETMSVPVCNRWVVASDIDEIEDEEYEEVDMITVHQIDQEDWRQPIVDYLSHQKLPSDPRHRMEIRRRAPRFILFNGTLFRRSFNDSWSRCIGDEETMKAMEEAHAGICGAHQSGPKLYDCLKTMGYYWPTMVQDSMDYAKKCEACQFHANFIHQPPEPLHPTVSSWPFEAWGLDVVGPITPKSSAGQAYILAATDYFSKWAEAIPLREVKKENVVDFIRTHIIYRYGIPRRIITDNGKPFFNTLMTSLCEKFKFTQHKSSMYNAPANGLAEAFNKTLCKLLSKVVSKSKRDWHERIGEALWAYRTSYKTATQSTPYALVYGVESILPLELQIPSLRVAIQEGLTNDENDRLRLAELEALDEKRLQAQQKSECYQARLSRAFNKKVRPRSFQVGDIVLAVRRPIITSRKTGSKFTSKWDGPYVVQEVYTNGAYKIVDAEGLRVGPINGKFLKRYYS